jgi:hypothetical protein
VEPVRAASHFEYHGFAVARTVHKLFVVLLLALCIGVHVLEVSGRWDQTLQDTNDEAGIVAAVLCVGVALAFTGTLLKCIRLSRIGTSFVLAALPGAKVLSAIQGVPRLSAASPPLALRI